MSDIRNLWTCFSLHFGFLTELNNLMTKNELKEHYALRMELMDFCGEG